MVSFISYIKRGLMGKSKLARLKETMEAKGALDKKNKGTRAIQLRSMDDIKLKQFVNPEERLSAVVKAGNLAHYAELDGVFDLLHKHYTNPTYLYRDIFKDFVLMLAFLKLEMLGVSDVVASEMLAKKFQSNNQLDANHFLGIIQARKKNFKANEFKGIFSSGVALQHEHELLFALFGDMVDLEGIELEGLPSENDGLDLSDFVKEKTKALSTDSKWVQAQMLKDAQSETPEVEIDVSELHV